MNQDCLRFLLGFLGLSLAVGCSPDNSGGPAAKGTDGGVRVDANGTGGAVSHLAGSGGSDIGAGGASGGSAGAAGDGAGTADAAQDALGGSGGDGSGGSAGAAVCDAGPSVSQADCDAAAALTTSVVSDFENGAGWVLFANPADTGGTTSPTAGGTISSTQISCSPNGRCGSQLAMHVTGSGFTQYGPTLSNDFAYADGTEAGAGMVNDASSYKGIMYWARVGDTVVTSSTLRLILNDVTSSPAGHICDPDAIALGAVTDANGAEAGTSEAGPPTSNACWDGWMTETTLTTAWTLVKVPFSSLKQGGWGKHSNAFVPTKVYGLTFQMQNRASFDFWIDDVAFYQ